MTARSKKAAAAAAADAVTAKTAAPEKAPEPAPETAPDAGDQANATGGTAPAESPGDVTVNADADAKGDPAEVVTVPASAAPISADGITETRVGQPTTAADPRNADDTATLIAPRAAVRLFTASTTILHDGGLYRPGDGIALTSAQHTALHAAGAVTAAWADADDGTA